MLERPDLQLLPLLRRLAAGKVDFVVIGGVAVAARGYARTTRDLDIVAAPNAENLELLGRVLVDLGASRHGIPFAADGQTLRQTEILTLDTPLGSIDLLRAPHGAGEYAGLRARAEAIDLGDAVVRVVALDDLLAMKRAAGRPQDLADINALETARRLGA